MIRPAFAADGNEVSPLTKEPPTSDPILDAGLTTLTFSRQSFLTIAEDFPKEKLSYQPFPGANQALWIMGHLANADEFFMMELGKKASPKFEHW